MNAVMESSCDSIAVLDDHGVIVSVNQVWRAFAESNGGSAALATGIGIVAAAGASAGFFWKIRRIPKAPEASSAQKGAAS